MESVYTFMEPPLVNKKVGFDLNIKQVKGSDVFLSANGCVEHTSSHITPKIDCECITVMKSLVSPARRERPISKTCIDHVDALSCHMLDCIAFINSTARD